MDWKVEDNSEDPKLSLWMKRLLTNKAKYLFFTININFESTNPPKKWGYEPGFMDHEPGFFDGGRK